MILDEDDRIIVVEASNIDPIHFSYECPYCWRLRNGRISSSNFCMKTKRLYTSATRNKHYHGSGGDLSNRREYRSSHCTINHKAVCIEINDNTKRNY